LALTPGTRLGVYDITAQIGVGGMGEDAAAGGMTGLACLTAVIS
jgi:hypothetical protein